MTLLSEIKDSAIVENLKKRFLNDWIFTYIGPVLISVNPFKPMKYFTHKEIDLYQGAAQYENPPHVYALADTMYRNMTIDNENQCVIISGESGAGKTFVAKYIMSYLSQVSGGGQTAQQVKDVILQSNPLLEAFGNAKTVRNNNSSRFGKYVEILFDSGQPVGGKISNFLLEKSRVVTQNPNERGFHIFYQFCRGMPSEMREDFGLTDPDYFNYLNLHQCYEVDGTDDVADYAETITAMTTIGLIEEEQGNIVQIVAAILHLGNIIFTEEGNDKAIVENQEWLAFPAFLLQVEKAQLEKKLISRVMETRWGSKTERLDVTSNVQQAETTRDALAKGLYARLFDYLVKKTNEAMKMKTKSNGVLNLGILDIYGFEIFQKNGFEQFCINFVNEKLQQIFIELTLKAEQEEYVQEGIQWTPIEYFNNAIVCQLIEEKRPPGVMAVLDDVCSSQHGVNEGADTNLKSKLMENCRKNQHFQDNAQGFAIHHYAGVVSYNVEGFCERNKDVFNVDLIELMQSSRCLFIKNLFPDVVDRSSKKRPITAGAKIKSQANDLVKSLMLCTPHYIRCIKPNETKKPLDWEGVRVAHQVEYLGLKENIRVRRAGFAYRRPFEKFLHRYAILTKDTWNKWSGSPQNGVLHIMKSAKIRQDEFQMGQTKVFVKAPESLFLLEESREKQFDHFARIIQKAFQRYFNRQKFFREKEQAAEFSYKKKQRRAHSLNRNFFADYIGLEDKPSLKSLVGKREKVEFAQTVNRYDKKLKGIKTAKRDLILNGRGIFLVGRELEKKGPNKGQEVETVSRMIAFDQLSHVSLSTRQDDFVILHVVNSYDSVLQIPFKTEFISVLRRVVQNRVQRDVRVVFADRVEFTSDKSRIGSGKKRLIFFENGSSNQEQVSAPGLLKGELRVAVKDGLPNTSKPIQAVIRLRAQVRVAPKMGLQSLVTPPTGQQPTNPRRVTPSQQSQVIRDAPVVPPPSHPAPAFQPRFRPSVKLQSTERPTDLLAQLKRSQSSASQIKRQESSKPFPDQNMNYLQTPEGGQALRLRDSIKGQRPLPAGGRPKPKLKQINARPKVRALYEYKAQDVDEIDISIGEEFDLVEEDESGWWRGINNMGQEGFFPGTYVTRV
ncbi:hypothetical protein TCAL_02955 [Tigriopus californicus]|uniref:Myosin motor domain-containing protein n=2 Tax=Tigriopus californicus TaxID=6832 RepID=A0A553NNY9_TIGCA|nr:unconventional myosin-If-like isoform X2 [Tigriopus californicus]TRY67144.1 hypothetical protein TCAL_02955 [Tigriopus californicus]